MRTSRLSTGTRFSFALAAVLGLSACGDSPTAPAVAPAPPLASASGDAEPLLGLPPEARLAVGQCVFHYSGAPLYTVSQKGTKVVLPFRIEGSTRCKIVLKSSPGNTWMSVNRTLTGRGTYNFKTTTRKTTKVGGRTLLDVRYYAVDKNGKSTPPVARTIEFVLE